MIEMIYNGKAISEYSLEERVHIVKEQLQKERDHLMSLYEREDFRRCSERLDWMREVLDVKA